jgi:outer membrane protein
MKKSYAGRQRPFFPSLIIYFITRLICLAAAVLLGSPSLLAQDENILKLGDREPALTKPTEGSEFKAVIGGGLAFTPIYEGSDQYKFRPIPIINISYRNVFFSLGQGLGVNIISDGTWRLAPIIGYRGGRDESLSHDLSGLGDVKGGLEIGALLSYLYGPAIFSVEGLSGLGQADGFTVELEANLHGTISQTLRGTVGISTLFANESYNQAYFGISEIQSRRSAYSAYNAQGGFKHVAFSGTLDYNLTERTGLLLFGEYRRLTGSVADSPIVREGSPNQFQSGLGLVYHLK